MRTALDEVASAADQLAGEQRQVASTARRMQRDRDRGLSWAAVLDREPAPHLLERLRSSLRLLGQITAKVAETLAQGLSTDGESRRQIAKRLGVTHQRVTAILRDKRS